MSRSVLFSALATAALIVSALPASAQQTPLPASQEDLEKRLRTLEEEVRTLKEAQAADKPASALPPLPTYSIYRTAAPPMAPGPYIIRTADGLSYLKVGGLIQSDTRVFSGRGESGGRTGNGAFYLRRVRPILDGMLGSRIGFRLMPDFFEGRAVLQDAYVDVNLSRDVTLRSGKWKIPYSLERVQGAAEMIFVERSLSNNLSPVRDVGVQLAGGPYGIAGVEWEAGVFNGAPENGFTDNDTDNEKEIIGRVFARPGLFRPRSPLAGLGIGFAGGIGRSKESLAGVGLRTAGRSLFFRYADGANGDGIRTRLAPQLFYYRGSYGLLTEYLQTRQRVRRDSASGAQSAIANLSGFTVQMNYVLTGETTSFRNVVPRKPFGEPGGRGAVEVAARWSRFHVNGDLFAQGLADAAVSANRADAYTVGANWYLTRQLKAQLQFERTEFGRPLRFGPALNRRREDVILSRLQINF